MKPTNVDKQSVGASTPGLFAASRNRLMSFNTPQLSPLKMVQSPFMALGEGSIFDSHLSLNNDFRLEEGPPQDDTFQQVNESSQESISQIQFPKFAVDQKVTKDNMVEFLVDSINSNEQRIDSVRQSFQQSGQVFLSEVFQYLYKRFKKSKKTKEEMIKYTMRKSFKFITDQMKRDDPTLIPLLSTDGLQGMSIYFTRNSQDQEISIPFKKNSLEKTMNTAFLKKVFSCERFFKDYKRFLKTFQNEFLKDNKKKINSMTESVKSCLATKSYKSLENYKRLPWTKDILVKLKTFAYELLSYSPFKNGQRRNMRASENGQSRNNSKIDIFEQDRPHKLDLFEHQKHHDDDQKQSQGKRLMSHYDHLKDLINDYEDKDEVDAAQPRKMKKKSVIILTPPILPMTSPKINDALNLD